MLLNGSAALAPILAFFCLFSQAVSAGTLSHHDINKIYELTERLALRTEKLSRFSQACVASDKCAWNEKALMDLDRLDNDAQELHHWVNQGFPEAKLFAQVKQDLAVARLSFPRIQPTSGLSQILQAVRQSVQELSPYFEPDGPIGEWNPHRARLVAQSLVDRINMTREIESQDPAWSSEKWDAYRRLSEVSDLAHSYLSMLKNPNTAHEPFDSIQTFRAIRDGVSEAEVLAEYARFSPQVVTYGFVEIREQLDRLANLYGDWK
jgi:hypothetical protein